MEDHLLMRQSMVEALERECDLTVCGQADDATNALAAIKSSQPDLVLTDIQLKSSSGVELIKALREQSPRILIVATTIFEARRTERLARAAGASGFVSKQEGPEQLIATIHALLSAAKSREDWSV